MKCEYFIYGILAVAVIGLIYAVWGFTGANEQAKDGKYLLKEIISGNTDTGNVELSLKPQGTLNGKFKVSISANTHSVSLEKYDLKKSAVLIYNGKEYIPVSAPELSGHHSSGDMFFELADEPSNFKITIKGIPSIEERVFEWGTK